MSMVERFWSKVDRRSPSECWLWKSTTTPNGYGRFWDGKRQVYAHRLSWEMANGKPLGNLLGCHRCDNPRCVNPSHIFPGTPSENIRDAVEKGRFIGWQAAKTHCPKGHPFSGDNLRIVKGGQRRCKACHNDYRRVWQRNMRAKRRAEKAAACDIWQAMIDAALDGEG